MISYLPIISYCDSSGRVGDSGLRWRVRNYQRWATKGAMVGVGKGGHQGSPESGWTLNTEELLELDLVEQLLQAREQNLTLDQNLSRN